MNLRRQELNNHIKFNELDQAHNVTESLRELPRADKQGAAKQAFGVRFGAKKGSRLGEQGRVLKSHIV